MFSAVAWVCLPQSGQSARWDLLLHSWVPLTWRTSWTWGHCSPWRMSQASTGRRKAERTSLQMILSPPLPRRAWLRSGTPGLEPRSPPGKQTLISRYPQSIFVLLWLCSAPDILVAWHESIEISPQSYNPCNNTEFLKPIFLLYYIFLVLHLRWKSKCTTTLILGFDRYRFLDWDYRWTFKPKEFQGQITAVKWRIYFL